jgi:hypothetical protein
MLWPWETPASEERGCELGRATMPIEQLLSSVLRLVPANGRVCLDECL